MPQRKGSKDCRPRQRRKKAPEQKKKDDADKARRTAAQEKANRDRNAGLFRASLFHGQEQSSTATIAPEQQEQEDEAVQLHGVSSWTEQRNPEDISAELDYDSDDESEEAEANEADEADEANTNSDGPSNSVMNLYL
jgi:hypothetical protein